MATGRMLGKARSRASVSSVLKLLLRRSVAV